MHNLMYTSALFLSYQKKEKKCSIFLNGLRSNKFLYEDDNRNGKWVCTCKVLNTVYVGVYNTKQCNNPPKLRLMLGDYHDYYYQSLTEAR